MGHLAGAGGVEAVAASGLDRRQARRDDRWPARAGGPRRGREPRLELGDLVRLCPGRHGAVATSTAIHHVCHLVYGVYGTRQLLRATHLQIAAGPSGCAASHSARGVSGGVKATFSLRVARLGVSYGQFRATLAKYGI